MCICYVVVLVGHEWLPVEEEVEVEVSEVQKRK